MAELRINFNLPSDVKSRFNAQGAPVDGYIIERKKLESASDIGPFSYNIPTNDDGYNFYSITVPTTTNTTYNFQLKRGPGSNKLFKEEPINFLAVSRPNVGDIPDVTVNLSPIFYIRTTVNGINGPTDGYVELYRRTGFQSRQYVGGFKTGSGTNSGQIAIDFTYNYFDLEFSCGEGRFVLEKDIQITPSKFWGTPGEHYIYTTKEFKVPVGGGGTELQFNLTYNGTVINDRGFLIEYQCSNGKTLYLSNHQGNPLPYSVKVPYGEESSYKSGTIIVSNPNTNSFEKKIMTVTNYSWDGNNMVTIPLSLNNNKLVSIEDLKYIFSGDQYKNSLYRCKWCGTMIENSAYSQNLYGTCQTCGNKILTSYEHPDKMVINSDMFRYMGYLYTSGGNYSDITKCISIGHIKSYF